MMTKRVRHLLLPPRVLFRTTPTPNKWSNLRILWLLCTNRLYIVLETKFILVCGISLIAGETWNIKATTANLKLWFWRDAFTNVSSSKWGIQRQSKMQSKCVFTMHCTTNLWSFAFASRRAFLTYEVNWGLILSPHKCQQLDGRLKDDNYLAQDKMT